MIQPMLVWELARKDLKLFLADRRGVLLCFAVPIVLASVFGGIFQQPDDGSHIRPVVLVVNQGDSSFSQAVEKALCDSDKLEVQRADLDTARRRLAQEHLIVLVLPADLPKAAQLGRQGESVRPNIGILHHPSLQLESRWVEGVLTEIVLRESARVLLEPLHSLSTPLERPFTVQRQTIPAGGALSVHAYSHSFCGMTLQYLLFWGVDSGLMLLRERRQGIWRRLRAAPITFSTLLLGKALATALIALAQMGVTFLFGALVFGVRVNGSILGFIILALALALLSASTGLLVAALGGNEGRSRSVAILVILMLSFLGGLWLPSFLLPGWAQQLAWGLPTSWAAQGLEGVVWQGMDLTGALRCAGMVLGFSLVFLVIAWWGLLRGDNRARLVGGK